MLVNCILLIISVIINAQGKIAAEQYIPPCWTETPPTTRPTSRATPWYTQSTTQYIPPCWSETIPSTPNSRSTVYPGLENFVCEERNNFYPIAYECDTFIECKENVARKRSCPEGLVYKPSTIWPNYPCVLTSEYQCLNGSITQPARPNGQCPHQDGYYSIPESDCTQYIVCVHGIATLMNCPAGLVFNEEKSICDWPIDVPSCNPNIFKEFTCPAVDDADPDVIYKYRYNRSCTFFVACQSGYPRLLSCPEGLRFDLNTQKCIDENDVTDCEA